MKLSVVIPAYNEEKYLPNCLESVLRQIKKSKFEVEVIVVDNASTDATSEVAKKFDDIKLVYESSKGLTKARNAGYQASSGDLIANMDSDSTMPDGWIEKVMIEFTKDENLAALSGPYIYSGMSKSMRLIVSAYYRVGYLGHLFNHYLSHKGAMLQGGNFILRRTALEKMGGYDLEFDFYGEDTDVARRAQKVGKVKFDFNLPMYTSNRRFEKEGVITTGLRYFINHVWTIVFKKPFTKSYVDIRNDK